MGKIKSHRSSLKMGLIIRKKAKAKRQREAKLAKTKQFPKRSKKLLVAPGKMPNREEIQEEIHTASEIINKEIRPIAQMVAQERAKSKNSYAEQMKEVKADIIRQYKERVNTAKESYNQLEAALEEADCFIEVVDARDPASCRYMEYEKKIEEKKKPLVIVLNKCDLVPKDIVISWIAFIRKTVQCIGLVAIQHESATALISQTLAQLVPSGGKVAVFGIKGVGKSTLCEGLDALIEIPSLQFAQSTEELCLLGAAVWQAPARDLALATITRAVKTDDQPDLYSIYGISTEIEDPEEVIDSFSEKWKTNAKKAAKRFMDELIEGKQLFFCTPPEDGTIPEDPAQVAALELSIPYDLSTHQYVQFAPGNAISVDTDLLNATLLDEEEDGDDEDAGEQ